MFDKEYVPCAKKRTNQRNGSIQDIFCSGKVTMMDNTNYYFEFAEPKLDFHLALPAHVASPKACKKELTPDWARLSCHQCPNCNLTDENTEYCPPAYNMIDLVEHFSSFNSYDRVNLHIWTNSEMHSIRTDVQRALAYLYPAILAGSSCPYAALLAPMTKFGKPFPDMSDFLFYALSFGLISGHLHDRKQHQEESTVLDTSKAFALAQVFHGLLLRIRESALSDANVNALVKDIQWSYVTLHPQMFLRNQMEKYFA